MIELVLAKTPGGSHDPAGQNHDQGQMEGERRQPGESPAVGVEMDLAVSLLRQRAISGSRRSADSRCAQVHPAASAAANNAADVSALRRKPWVVVTEGWAMACQIPGARLIVQTAMATARSVRIAANGSERKTSQAYQRSMTGVVTGNVSAIDLWHGAAAQRADEHEQGEDRDLRDRRPDRAEKPPDPVDDHLRKRAGFATAGCELKLASSASRSDWRDCCAPQLIVPVPRGSTVRARPAARRTAGRCRAS